MGSSKFINFKAIEEYILSYYDTAVDYPFDAVTAVYRIQKKMFALISKDREPLQINLKCDPEKAQALRSAFEEIIPGYHMNKDHWNTVILNGTLPDSLIEEMIDHSYHAVIKTLKKNIREEIYKHLDS